MLDYSRTSQARLVPLARGVLYLSALVPADIIAYNSRIGTMPAVTTIKSAMRRMSDHKALVIRSLGRDVSVVKRDSRRLVKVKIIIFDNTQHFRRQRDFRMGRENSMIIGVAGTFSHRLVPESALDVLDRRHRISLNLRQQLTVDKLLGLVDMQHLREVGILQWIQALTTFVPEMAIYKHEVSLRYKTRCAKHQMPIERSEIHPLATSNKNEALVTELKDTFSDFLHQLGQTEDDYD